MPSASVPASPWLLHEEPDLTPEQVWMGWAIAGQGDVRTFREGVVIADTVEQVDQVLRRARWTPTVRMNEAALSAFLAQAQTRPAHEVGPVLGAQRFALLFANPDTGAVRLRWVLVSPEAAPTAWQALGEPHAPVAVVPLLEMTALRDRVRQVRLARGVGALADGRPFDHPHERSCALVAQGLPGGRAQFDQRVQNILERCRRAQTHASLTSKGTP